MDCNEGVVASIKLGFILDAPTGERVHGCVSASIRYYGSRRVARCWDHSLLTDARSFRRRMAGLKVFVSDPRETLRLMGE